MSNRMPVDISGEGCMNTVALKSSPEFDTYCPAMDQSECKSPHRVNYFKLSCAGRLENKLCSFKPCQFRKKETIKYNYVHCGYGILQTSERRWAIYDTDDVKVGGKTSVIKCKEFINGLLKNGEFNDTRLHRQKGGF